MLKNTYINYTALRYLPKFNKNMLNYSKLEENQAYEEQKINTVKHCATQFRKLWPWVSAFATLAVISCVPSLLSARQAAAGGTPPPQLVISCYYNTPSGAGHAGGAELQPDRLPPTLCTHINVAFARLLNKSIHLEPSQYQALKEVVKLKQKNPMLKVLLSIGGAGENNGFSEMVVNHASRKIFIKSIKKTLKDYSLDGIDLDWEFPVLHNSRAGLSNRERQHFSQLLREIRMEYIREKRDYILSVALAAPQSIADVAYDVDQINLYVDFANIMTYDFHYYSKFTPFTGFNSPLYARATEELFLATLNINYTVQMYRSKGLDSDKIVVGIPTYGHSFKLVNEENPSVGSPASGWGAVGARGFADYPAVCAFAAAHAHDAQLRWDGAARAPFLYRGAEWLSYETPRSVAAKAAFVRAARLRGAMIYSLNADDYRGGCARAVPDPAAAFPLLRSAAAALRGRMPRCAAGATIASKLNCD